MARIVRSYAVARKPEEFHLPISPRLKPGGERRHARASWRYQRNVCEDTRALHGSARLVAQASVIVGLQMRGGRRRQCDGARPTLNGNFSEDFLPAIPERRLLLPSPCEINA